MDFDLPSVMKGSVSGCEALSVDLNTQKETISFESESRGLPQEEPIGLFI